MKALLLIVLSASILISSCGPFSQSSSKRFDVEAGYYQPINIQLEKRLQRYGYLTGVVQFDECRTHEDYSSGVWFRVTNSNSNLSHQFSILCDRNNDKIIVHWRFIEGDNYLVTGEQKIKLSKSLKEPITFEFAIDDNNILFNVDNNRFKEEIGFTPVETKLYAVGSLGSIKIDEIQ